MIPKLVGDGPVVIVDDNSDHLEISRTVFEASEVKNEVRIFQGGQELFEYLDKVEKKAEAMPSIILLDINMPNYDGFQIIKKIRGSESFKNYPIIVTFTSSNDPSDMLRSQAAGANSHMVKPWGIDEFIDFVNSLVA